MSPEACYCRVQKRMVKITWLFTGSHGGCRSRKPCVSCWYCLRTSCRTQWGCISNNVLLSFFPFFFLASPHPSSRSCALPAAIPLLSEDTVSKELCRAYALRINLHATHRHKYVYLCVHICVCADAPSFLVESLLSGFIETKCWNLPRESFRSPSLRLRIDMVSKICIFQTVMFWTRERPLSKAPGCLPARRQSFECSKSVSWYLIILTVCERRKSMNPRRDSTTTRCFQKGWRHPRNTIIHLARAKRFEPFS